jgi:hypothetical protein
VQSVAPAASEYFPTAHCSCRPMSCSAEARRVFSHVKLSARICVYTWAQFWEHHTKLGHQDEVLLWHVSVNYAESVIRLFEVNIPKRNQNQQPQPVLQRTAHQVHVICRLQTSGKYTRTSRWALTYLCAGPRSCSRTISRRTLHRQSSSHSMQSKMMRSCSDSLH